MIEKGLGTVVPLRPKGEPLEDSELEVVISDDEEPSFPEEEEEDEDAAFAANLADILPETSLQLISQDLLEDYESDQESRKEWLDTFADGLTLLGLKIEERSEPWENACGVFHPLLSEALVRFQADTMMETFPAKGPVETKIIGQETSDNRDAARRVKEDMNYQLTKVMVEYRPEHERMLWGLGLSGNAFKKVYFDPSLDRQTAVFVPAEDVVVPFGASNLETAERVTHIMRKTVNEMAKLQASGFYRDIPLQDPDETLDDSEKKIAESQGFSVNTDERYRVLEMQVDLLIPDDEYASANTDQNVASPYIVTIEQSSGEVLAIRRNWRQDDEQFKKRMHFVHYSYIPGFGFYSFGLIHLIGGFAKSGTSLIRQLVDAGTLSNLPGGFKTKGMRVKGDDTPIGPAEWRDVDIASGTLRDNLMPLPYKEPSVVLFQLLQNIVEEGRRLAGIADLKISDMSAQAPVGTTLAILERMLKAMSAVQARVHYAMARELEMLRDIIRDHTEDEYGYQPEDGQPSAKRSDYDRVDVCPVSDPNAATMAQKIVQYQAVLQLAQTAPQVYDIPLLHRQMLDVIGIENANKLVPLKDDGDMKPRDPVSENMDVINGKPVKAFIWQDHEAHITVHMSAMQDPQIMQVMGQNPNAQAMQSAMMAHVNEHIAFEYRKRIEEASGVPYPAPEAEMNPETEVEISRLAAAAAKAVLAQSQAEAAQQQAQQAAQDPIVQMQQKELEIKQKDAETKEKKLAIDAATQADKIEIERGKLELQAQMAGLKLATDRAELASEEQREGLKLGIEIAEKQAGMQNAERDFQTGRADRFSDKAEQMQAGERARGDQEANRFDRLHKEDTDRQDRLSEAEANRKASAEQAKAKAKSPPKEKK